MERQFSQRKMVLGSGRPVRTTAWGGRAAARIIGLGLIVLLAGDAAFADFLVQPMLLRKAVQPGKRITLQMTLQNTDLKKDENITLSLAELSQNPDSSWIDLQPNDPNLSKYPIRSCKSWIAIPPEPIAVPHFKQQSFVVQIDVPAGTRGFYFAALLADTATASITDETGVVTGYKFGLVVPIVLEVQSAAVPVRISLADVGLQFRKATPEIPAATFISVDVANTGGSFSSIAPVVRLSTQSSGHSRKVVEAPVGETGILPGIKLHMLYDVGKPLASGPYRVEALLFVDGRRADSVTKMVQFEGDPTVASNALLNVPVELEPTDTILEMVPGATRSGVLKVTNRSEELVKVETEFALPADMQSHSTNHGVPGDDLSCVDWVTIQPRQFTMNGYSRTSLQVLARMPKGAAQYPCYYGTLKLRFSYRDGTPAGTKETYICIQNKQVRATAEALPAVLSLSELTPGRYQVTAGYRNGGELYFTPSCLGDLSVAGVGGVNTYKRFLMSSETYGQKGLLLPLQTRTFSGVLDLADVQPAQYYLTSILRWEKDKGSPTDGLPQQQTIIVTEQGGRKYARTTETAQAVPIKLQ